MTRQEKMQVGRGGLKIGTGDDENYKIMARLVAQEFSKGKFEKNFAAMRPWEAKKMLLSSAVTDGIGYGPGWQYKTYFIDNKKLTFTRRPKEMFT